MIRKWKIKLVELCEKYEYIRKNYKAIIWNTKVTEALEKLDYE